MMPEEEDLENVSLVDEEDDIKVEPKPPGPWFIRGMFFVGLLFAFTMGYHFNDPCEFNQTEQPTAEPTMEPTWDRPTEQPTVEPGPHRVTATFDAFKIAGITDHDVQKWKAQFKDISSHMPFVKTEQDYLDACAKYNKPMLGQIQYKNPSDHVRDYIKNLCRYYMPLEGSCNLEQSVDPQDPGTIRRYVRMLKHKIKHKENITVGIMGTSVFSGMDNCYASTYGPTVERALNRLMKPLGVHVNVRNAASNGDGMATAPQLACSDSIFNLEEIDMMHMFWDMIPQAPLDVQKGVMDAWLSRNILPFYFSNGQGWSSNEKYLERGVLRSKFRNPSPDPSRYSKEDDFPGIKGYHALNPWYRNLKGGHWGKHDDGRCHLQTREGFDGVFMQNWHPGPLTNQMYSDSFTFYFAKALLLALEGNDDGVYDVQVPKPLPTCILSHGKTLWNSKYNIRHTRVENKDNPYEELHENSKYSWKYEVIKQKSSMGHDQDLDESEETKHASCHAHVDEDYGFVNHRANEWITIKVPPISSGSLTVCRSNIKHNKFGISTDKLHVRINNQKFSMKPVDDVCIRTIEKVPTEQVLFLSISAEQSGTQFNLISDYI